ncbi:MAG: aspartate aminotransferase family protein [Thermoplasmata archaeon]
MQAEEFRRAGRLLVDEIAEFLSSLPDRSVVPNEPPRKIRKILGQSSLPQQGKSAETLLKEATQLFFNHSVFNGHPRFWGYITSSAAPLGALGDLLAASVNPNVGAWALSPIASEIEAQTVRWMGEMLGYPPEADGLLVSGGNMANFIGFLAARRAKTSWDVRKSGMAGTNSPLLVYCSEETHTWIQKATDLFGLGTDSIRWVPTDEGLRMDTSELRRRLDDDREEGGEPFLVIGTAGTVGTGAIDPLTELATICREYDLWFHVDAAYGGFAAVLPDAPKELRAMGDADSIAVDPHKWLYSPLEAGCALVRDAAVLRDTFSYHPDYYKFDEVRGEAPVNYFDYGPQNSRGFRALKVWLGLRQAGREGYVKMISDDIRLSKELYRLAEADPELEALTQSLSITTFRYLPTDLRGTPEEREAYLNALNASLLTLLQEGGEVFLSNAVVGGKFALRVCVVNFRTNSKDIAALPVIVKRVGRQLDTEMRPEGLRK